MRFIDQSQNNRITGCEILLLKLLTLCQRQLVVVCYCCCFDVVVAVVVVVTATVALFGYRR